MADVAATTIFLVRHAAHDRLDRVLCGRSPGVRLGEEGRRQAGRVADRLSRERIAALFSSPLERAQETAVPIAGALELQIEPSEAINEIDCGEWTGQSFEALRQDGRWHLWNRERATSSTPGGEAMHAVQARVAAEMERWRARFPDRAIAAVSHSDVIKTAVCHVLGLSLDRYHAFEIAPASITTLVIWEGGGKVLTMGEHASPVGGATQ